MDTEEALVAELERSRRVGEVPERRYVEPAILLASSCSALSARLLCHPLDTLRIRIQTAKTDLPWKQLVPKPRLQHLYAGLPVALAFSIPSLSVYMTCYEATKRYLNEQWLPQDREATLLQQLPVFVAAGTAAELASGVGWTASDVLKSRLQSGNDGTRALPLIRKIIREEGWRGLQRGYLISTVVFIPNVSLYWVVYESLKVRFIPGYSSHRPAAASTALPVVPPEAAPGTIPVPLRYTLCSVVACAMAATTTTPIEVVQAKWQTSGGKIAGGIPAIVKEMYRQGGIKSFTRGLSMRIAYAIPANACSMSVYEAIKRYNNLT